MYRFLNSFEALLSIQFLVKCRNIILPTVMTPHEKYNHSSAQLFSMFNVVLTHVDYQNIYYRKQLGFVAFDDKNHQRRRKFVGERDFPILNSYTGQFQCLRHSRDQKFVTSFVQSAIDARIVNHKSFHDHKCSGYPLNKDTHLPKN